MTTLEVFGGLGVLIAGLLGVIKLQANRNRKIKQERDTAKTQAKINATALEETSKSNIERKQDKDEMESLDNKQLVSGIIDWLRKTNAKNSDR